MKSDDRFTAFAVSGALLVTVAVFIWSHPGLVNITPEVEVKITTLIPETVSAPVQEPCTTPVGPVVVALNDEDRDEPDVVFASFVENNRADLVTLMAEGRDLAGFALPEFKDVLVRINRDGRTVVAGGTHRQYEDFVQSVEALDIDEVALALESGPEELRITFFEAIENLLATPLAEEDPDMESKGSHWGFADADYESLDTAQKHMLLMGRSQARDVRTKLIEMRDVFEIVEPVPSVLASEPVQLADALIKGQETGAVVSP